MFGLNLRLKCSSFITLLHYYITLLYGVTLSNTHHVTPMGETLHGSRESLQPQGKCKNVNNGEAYQQKHTFM